MSVLITCGQNPLSWVICKLTKEPASHIAIRCDDWVLHSNLLGVQWTRYSHFKPNILSEISIEENTARLLAFSAMHVDRGHYDFGGFLYCGLRLALRTIGIRLPKKNLWRMTGMFMCTELVTSYVYGEEDAMITPTQLGLKLRTLDV